MFTLSRSGAFSYKSSAESTSPGSRCSLSLLLNGNAANVTILNAKASTVNQIEDMKEQFYDELNVLIGRASHSENILLLVDFSARVGSNHQS